MSDARGGNIILCGFMGSGKTTLGQILARQLCTAFVDIDQCVQSITGKDIPTLFAQHGEAGFREVEHRVLLSLLQASTGGAVISTGGGVCTYVDNIALMREKGTVVFLNPGFAVCYARIHQSDRPIVRSSSKAELRDLYQNRIAGYRQAAHVEVAASGPADRCVKEILAAVGQG